MPKTKAQRKEELKYLNGRIKKKFDLGLETDSYTKAYVPLTDKQIEDIVEGTDKSRESIRKAGKVISDIIDVMEDDTGTLNPYNFDDVLLARIAPEALDYSFLNYEKDSPEYKKINDKNLATIEKLKTPEGAQEIFNQMISNLLAIDMSKVLTGSLKNRLEYLKDHTSEMLTLFVINDIMSASQIKNIPEDLKKALESRQSMLQSIGGIIGIGRVANSDYFPMFEKMNPVDAMTLSLDQWGYSHDDEEVRTQKQKDLEESFFNYIKKCSIGLETNHQILEVQNAFKLFADNAILGSGDDSVRFEPRDKDGNPIDFETASKKIEAKEKVFFVERTQEEIDHMLRGKPAPEKKFKDEIFEISGNKILRTADNLNPVLPHVKQMTPEEEKAAALKWFDSFSQLLSGQDGDYKFDTAQKLDTNRLKTFSLGASYASVVWTDTQKNETMTKTELQRNSLLENKSVIDTNAGELDIEKYINKSVALKDLTDEQKLQFYRCAKEGKLVFNSADFNPEKAKAVYINSDGKAALSGLIKNMTTENYTLENELKLDKNYAKKLFPGCEYADDMARQYGDYESARVSTLGMSSHLTDKKLAEHIAEGLWEGNIQKEYKNHPEFFADTEDMKARSEIIANGAKASLVSLNKDWEKHIKVLNEHPASYYDDVQSFMKKKIGMSVEEAAGRGYLTYGNPGERNKLFLKGNKILRPNEKSHPWDLVDSVSQKILSEENVYISLPGKDNTLKEYKVIPFNEGFRMDEIVPAEKYRQASESIKKLCERVNETGLTRGDSSEFILFRNYINKLSGEGLPENLSDFSEKLGELRKRASDYVFEKLDQRQNTRRAHRFDAAADTIVEINSITDYYHSSLKEKEMYIIAAKASKAMLTAMSKGEGEVASGAKQVLENRDLFDQNMEALFEKPYFQSIFKKGTPEELKKIAGMSASDLGKIMIKAKNEYAKQMKNAPEKESKSFKLEASKHVQNEAPEKKFPDIFSL